MGLEVGQAKSLVGPYTCNTTLEGDFVNVLVKKALPGAHIQPHQNKRQMVTKRPPHALSRSHTGQTMQLSDNELETICDKISNRAPRRARGAPS